MFLEIIHNMKKVYYLKTCSTCIRILKELNLSSKLLVWNLHRHNMAVHYWTINDEDEMRRLIELGADGIITDYPELLISILNE